MNELIEHRRFAVESARPGYWRGFHAWKREGAPIRKPVSREIDGIIHLITSAGRAKVVLS